MSKWTKRRIEFLRREYTREHARHGRSTRWRLLYTIKLRLQRQGR